MLSYCRTICSANFRSAKPFLSTEQYAASEKLIKDFGSPGKEGEKLQALLQKRSEQEENWVIFLFFFGGVLSFFIYYNIK